VATVVDGCLPALGVSPSVATLATPAGALKSPRALAFNPAAPTELWVADIGRDGLTMLDINVTHDHVEVHEARVLKDRAQYHYMDHVSSIAFDPIGQFATCQESLNTYEGQMLPNFFMGPTLYDTRVHLVNSKQQPCEPGDTCFLIHTDMLHESPLCMGLVHDAAGQSTLGGTTYRNVYWAFGGGHRQLVRYDFESDHGPGSMDHSKASVRRYTGLELTRAPGVPSHMALDAAARKLYISDSGADRIVVVDVDSGRYVRDAKVAAPDAPAYQIYSSPEASFNYSVWDGLVYATYARVPMPSGIALSATALYVASHATGQVYGFDRATGVLAQVVAVAPPATLVGIALAPPTIAAGAQVAEQLYAIDQAAAAVRVVRPAQPCAAGALASSQVVQQCANGVRNAEESDVDCGGRACARCAVGQSCLVASDCESSVCSRGVCAASVPLVHSASFLTSYLSSDFYSNSFAHHMIHGDMGGASYLNPYPIMAADFCSSVGRDNVTGALNCSRVDYDALLLGGCWCHTCLPENPCINGGRCENFEGRGYTCACPAGYMGDHCQHAAAAGNGGGAWAAWHNALNSTFPFYNLAPVPSPPPPASPDASSPSPASPPLPSPGSSSLSTGAIAAIAASCGGALLLALSAALLWRFARRPEKRPTRTAEAAGDKEAKPTLTKTSI